MTVRENLFLGREPVRRGRIDRAEETTPFCEGISLRRVTSIAEFWVYGPLWQQAVAVKSRFAP